jgi:endonuclease/exonuclease/phosphatase family metal-dependent hydrolase
VTLNLWGRRGDWDARQSLIMDGLRGLQPDLVAFIEAIVTDDYEQVADLLGAGYHVAHQTVREPDGQGASIASRWPLGDVSEVDLNVTPRTADFACTTLVAEVGAPEPFGPLLFVDHVPNWQLNFERERELQALAAARHIEELVARQPRHVVFAGDFTADPDAASVRLLTGRQSLDGTSVCYRDAWEAVNPDDRGETFTPRNPLVDDWDWPFLRLDYILVRCGEHGGPTLEIASCERIFRRAGRRRVGQRPLRGRRRPPASDARHGSGQRLRSARISRAALDPGPPVMPPPGWAPDPAR